MCGVVGAIGVQEAALTLSIMLHALQNRGRDGCGISVIQSKDGGDWRFHCETFAGTVAHSITGKVLKRLPGDSGIGHTRYATAANSDGRENLQPLFFQVDKRPFAIAHNGNFTNIEALEATELRGTPVNTASDTERFLRLILREHRSERSLPQSVARALSKMQGSCSAVLHTPGSLLAIRDSTGNRPLYWGKTGSGYAIASETCALDAIGIFEVQEVPPGTVMVFAKNREPQLVELPKQPLRMCTFELLYFGFPTSTIFGVPVSQFRHELGRKMAQLHPVVGDLIVGIPDSAMELAVGYASGLNGKLPNEDVIKRRHDTGRTFILQRQKMREMAVSRKFSFNTPLIRGKRVVLIDDSLVRGTTSRGITDSLRRRGAKEVHWVIPSPPIVASCLYGINTANSSQLLAAHMSVEEMRQEITADSLSFLSLQDFQEVITSQGMDKEHGCYSCMTGEYWH